MISKSIPNSYFVIGIGIFSIHSKPMRNQMKLKATLKGSLQGEWVCFKKSKDILLEILLDRTWKDCVNSYQPSQPEFANWLTGQALASMALPCPIC